MLVTFTHVARATPFAFNFTYDGSAATLDATSDALNVIIQPGDNFTLSIKAANNDYFEVTETFMSNFAATFYTNESSVRVGNILTSLLFNDSVVTQEARIEEQALVHMGMQSYFQFGGGLIFDELKVDYSLLSSTAGPTTINIWNALFPQSYLFSYESLPGHAGPFFKSPYISYRDVTGDAEEPAEEVPEPMAMGLLTLAISTLGYFNKRRRSGKNRSRTM